MCDRGKPGRIGGASIEHRKQVHNISRRALLHDGKHLITFIFLALHTPSAGTQLSTCKLAPVSTGGSCQAGGHSYRLLTVNKSILSGTRKKAGTPND
jgi:hypothetical protein